jgi:hypothetical protein
MNVSRAQTGYFGGVWFAAVRQRVKRAAFRAMAGKSGSDERRLECGGAKVSHTGDVWSAFSQKWVKRAAVGPLWARTGSNGSRLARWSAKVGPNGAG